MQPYRYWRSVGAALSLRRPEQIYSALDLWMLNIWNYINLLFAIPLEKMG